MTTQSIQPAHIWAARKAVGKYLFAGNINMIDIGNPQSGEELIEDQISIRFHVNQKLPRVALEAAVEAGRTVSIPPEIEGVSTDVREAPFRLHQGWWWTGGWTAGTTISRTSQVDPLQGGISISDEFHYDYGTLGGLVIDRATGKPMILSNWHVLVSEWYAQPGQRIYQPGRANGGTSSQTVATLARDAMSVNLDAAVAFLTHSGRDWANTQLGLGAVKGVGKPALGMEVVKSGCGSGVTYGRITGLFGTQRITYVGLERMIRNTVTIDQRQAGEEVSRGGDSGSFWLDASTRQAVGLHFAGSDYPRELGLAMDMGKVLDALAVDLMT
jgi:hypothetical protein